MHPELFDDMVFNEGGRLHGKEMRELEEIYSKIAELSALLREKMMQKWNRCLPLNELLGDRWERARYLGFGEGSSIYDSSLVFGRVAVGEHTWIGPFTILDGSGGLEIGDYCSISSGVQIYTHDSVKWAVSGGKENIERAPTRIDSRCYIGPNTIVAKGVRIGEGSYIGSMSLVLRDIPPGSKAWGVPARVVGGA